MSLFTPAKRPDFTELIMTRNWLGSKSISRFIAQHECAICDVFANLLLNDSLAVQSIRSSNADNDAFVNAILRKWVASVEPPPIPCTWGNLVDCMKKAGLDGVYVQTIGKNMCS